jgi:addiction module HigA family antidote
MIEEKLKSVHPGEVLLEEFLKPMGLSQNQLALSIGVSPRRINEIVLGKRRVTANTALRLARYFGMSPQFWLGLQMDHDLDVTEDEIAERLQLEVRPYVAVAS